MRRNEFAEKVDTSPSVITDTVKGRRRPPIDRIEVWADALGLSGDARMVFLDLAALEHLPAEVRPRFLRIYQEHRELLAIRDSLLAEEGKPIPPRI